MLCFLVFHENHYYDSVEQALEVRYSSDQTKKAAYKGQVHQNKTAQAHRDDYMM